MKLAIRHAESKMQLMNMIIRKPFCYAIIWIYDFGDGSVSLSFCASSKKFSSSRRSLDEIVLGSSLANAKSANSEEPPEEVLVSCPNLSAFSFSLSFFKWGWFRSYCTFLLMICNWASLFWSLVKLEKGPASEHCWWSMGGSSPILSLMRIGLSPNCYSLWHGGAPCYTKLYFILIMIIN